MLCLIPPLVLLPPLIWILLPVFRLILLTTLLLTVLYLLVLLSLLDRLILLDLLTYLVLQVLPADTLIISPLESSDILDLPLVPINDHPALNLRVSMDLEPMSLKIFLTFSVMLFEHSSLHPTAMMAPFGNLAKSFSKPVFLLA